MPADSRRRIASSLHSTIMVATWNHLYLGVREEGRESCCSDIVKKEEKQIQFYIFFSGEFLVGVDVCCNICYVLHSFCVGISRKTLKNKNCG